MWSGKKGSETGAGTPTEEEIKVVLVGDTQCGKTSLVQRFVSDTFVEVRSLFLHTGNARRILFIGENGRLAKSLEPNIL